MLARCHALQGGTVQAQQRVLGVHVSSKPERSVHGCVPSTSMRGRAVCTPASPSLTCSWRPSINTRSAANTDGGSEAFFEVLTADKGKELLLAAKGMVWVSTVSSMQGSSDIALQLQPQGWQLNPKDAVVKAFPGWNAALSNAQAAATLPSAMTVHSPAVVSSANRLEGAVQLDASLWCDGTAPNDPPLDGLQYQLLCAGEIASLLAGKRGVVMVQLQVDWDKRSPQPMLNPLALHILRKALQRPDLSIFVSKAPGGLGLTAIMAAKVEPFRSWTLHLASFGTQEALVAESPEYKLLNGRVMGYKEANIIHHIQTTSGRNHSSPEVLAAVTLNMAKLSKKKPQLPWTQHAQQQGGRRGARGKKSQ